MDTAPAWARALVRVMPRGLRAALAPSGLTPVRGRGTGGWFPLTVREPFTGAWQQNAEITVDSVVMNPTVFAAVTLIASDCAKLRLRLVEQTGPGVWSETTNPAYSPVLRRPNRYQTIQQFISCWMQSKLLHGNTYVLKVRDGRGVVVAMYVLDPQRVTVLVATDGAVYYELKRDDLSGVLDESVETPLVVPASEIVHDLMNPFFHPLVGLSPIYAAALTASQGLRTMEFSAKFFANDARPGGVLTAPGAVGDATVARVKEYWETNFSGENVGRVAVLGDGLKYEAMTMTAVDAQLIEQLRWGAETIATVYHVPPYLVVPGAPTPPYTGPEALFQQYYSQCIQTLLTSAEQVLDHGLGLDPLTLGTEFDIDDLVWMDTASKTKAAGDGIVAGVLSPNEARQKYFGLGPVPGGESPYLQQQNYSLAALAERDANSPLVKTAPPSAPPAVPQAASAASAILRRFHREAANV